MQERRIKKINELIKREIGQIILRDFAANAYMLTITRIDTAANLRSCRVYVSVMPENSFQSALDQLANDIGEIQHIFNRRLKIKPVPKIIFEPDYSGIKMTKTLESLNKISDE